ncbi:MAG: hypothetical protein U9R19_05945 [Bacteroidota bacterium]|nr:hypothetical protein [Bacteroidota bacterium]
MKKLFLLTTMLFVVAALQTSKAQTPEPVHSIVKELKPYEWYVEQAGLWKNEIKKDSGNAPAWYNYYIANRMANLTGKPDKWNSAKDKILQELNEIVDEMEKTIPESFEYNHVKWWNGGNNPELFPYLEKAYAIAPERHEVYDDFITRYEIKRNKKEEERFCKLWYKSGDVSPGILSMNYNVLMSLDENAILFTAGDNDTYPIWILQYAKKIRKDVTVLNTSLIFIDEYADAMLKELGIGTFDKEVSDFVSAEIKKSKEYQLAYNAYQKALIKHIIDNAGKHPVYFAVSARKRLYDEFEDKLYIEGMAFKYSEHGYDNLAILRRNVEKRFLLDYLKIDLSNDFSESVVNHSNFNYIMPFINLYDHYMLTEEKEKASRLKSLAITIAKRANKEDEIEKQFPE